MGRDADAYIVYGIKLELDWAPKKALSPDHAKFLEEEEEEYCDSDWAEYLPKGVKARHYGLTCYDTQEIALYVPGTEVNSWGDGRFNPEELSQRPLDTTALRNFCDEHEIKYNPCWLLLASYG